MKRLLFLFLVFLCLLQTINAQQKTVTGTIKSSVDGEPVIGATIIIRGTASGTVTDLNGNFSIGVPGGMYTEPIICLKVQGRCEISFPCTQ